MKYQTLPAGPGPYKNTWRPVHWASYRDFNRHGPVVREFVAYLFSIELWKRNKRKHRCENIELLLSGDELFPYQLINVNQSILYQRARSRAVWGWSQTQVTVWYSTINTIN